MSKGGGGYQYIPTVQSSNTNTSNNIPDWLTNASKAGINAATGLVNAGTPNYTGELSPGMNATQTSAGDMYKGQVGAYQPYFDQASNYTNNAANSAAPDVTAQTFANGLSGIGQYMNPYISNVVDSVSKLGQQNLANSLNQTNDQAIASKAFGGSRHGVQEGIATAQNNLNTNNLLANLLSSGYNQATSLLGNDISNNMQGQLANQANANNTLNRQLSAGSQIANIGSANQSAQNTGIQNVMAYGNQQQQTQAAQDQAAYNNWLYQQQYPFQALQAYNQTVQGAPHSTNGTSSTTSIGMQPMQQQSSSPLTTALGLGLGGLSMLGTGGLSGIGGAVGKLGLGLLGGSPFPSSYSNPYGYR